MLGSRRALLLLLALGLLGLAAAWLLVRGPRSQEAAAAPAPSEAPATAAPDSAVRPADAEADAERTVVAEADAASMHGVSVPTAKVVEPSRWMRARVVDEHGNPLAGASMSFDSDFGVLQATSDAEGKAALAIPEARFAGTTYIFLNFAAEGRTSERRRIDLRSEGEGNAGEVALLPAGSIVGRILVASGSPQHIQVGVCDPLPPLADEDRERLEALGLGFFQRGPRSPSQADGTYRIDQVPTGTWIVAARQPGAFYVWSDPLNVQAGQVVDAGTLVFKAPDPDQCIAGVVLDSAGNPSALQPVQLWKPGVARNVEPQAQSARTDAQGQFRFAVQRGSVYHVVVLDQESMREELVRLEDVTPGGPPLVLRIPELRVVEVTVRSEQGQLLEQARFGLTDADGFGFPVRSEPLAQGTWRVELLARPFRLAVYATGYESKWTEVLDPAATPERLEFALKPEQGARILCVLSRGGEPFSDAQVLAYAPLEGPHRLNTGFATRLASQLSAVGRAGTAAGVYELRVAMAGSLVLLVSTQNHVLLEHGPIQVSPADPERRIELELPELGSIEGSVLLAEGRSPAGLLLGASRGDGEVRALTLGEDPSFRFTGLAPGLWQVRTIGKADNPHLLEDRRAYRTEAEPVWDVALEPGQAARFDIDLSHEALCQVRGRVRLAPDGPSGWMFSLGGGFGEQVNSDGSFLASIYEPGPRNLILWANWGPKRRLMLHEQLDLKPGETSWTLDLTTAELELTGVPAFEEEERSHEPELLRLQWTGSGTQQGTLRILSHAGGPLVLPGLPPGHWVVETRYAEDGSPERQWRQSVAEIVLEPGQRQTLEL